MITSIRLQNFKAHRDTTVPLGRFTVLVGPNGAGKTSVLEALAIQSALVKRPARDVFQESWSAGDVLYRSASGPISITSQGVFQGLRWSMNTQVSPGDAPKPNWTFELSWDLGARKIKHSNAATSMIDVDNTMQGPTAMGEAVLYRLNARQVAAAGYSEDPEPRVGADGSDTAVVLAAMKLMHDDEFQRVQSELRLVVPNVERIRFAREKVFYGARSGENLRMGDKILIDFRGASGVPAHAASDGTLVTLAILTLLHSSTRPRVLLLDDFDYSLHPVAQMELVRQLNRLLEELPDVQIVATTHSPYILDQLDASDVHVFALREDGSVAARRLSEHPELPRMKGALSAGQIWTLDPERRWVLDEAAR